MIMLSEQLEKISKIGTVKSIIYLAHWLSAGVNSLDDMLKCIQGQPNVKISEVRPILGLFELMSLIEFNGDKIISTDTLNNYGSNSEKFQDWFTSEYISFVIRHNFIDRDGISYSIANHKYILSPTAINPRKHACFRNLLIDLGIIEYLPGEGYQINRLLAQALLHAENNKVSEEELLDNLEKQKEQGKEGEEFVLVYERNRITKEDLRCRIERISALDVSSGFDIVSFNDNDSKNFDRFIEVKTYIGRPHFYWSKNEIEKAQLMGDAYYIYLVDFQQIKQKDYVPQCISNPIRNIILATNWIKTTEELFVEPLYVDGYSNNFYTSTKLQDGDKPEFKLDIYSDQPSIQMLVDTAISIGIDSVRALKHILSNVRDRNSGIYQPYLERLEDAERQFGSNL